MAGLQAGAEFPRNNLDRAKGSGIKIHKARVSRPFHDYTPFKREARFRTTTHGGADDGTKISRSGKSLLIHFENGIQRRDRFLHAYHVEAIRWKSVLFRRESLFFFFFSKGDNQDLARVSDRLDPIHPILSLRPCGLTINFSLEERRERKIRGKIVGRPKSILE